MTGGCARAEGLLRTIWTPLLLSLLMVGDLARHHRDRQRRLLHRRGREVLLRLLIVLALQMFSGNSGILSFGQVAFVAVGAYTSALLTIPTAIKQFTFLSMPHLLKDWVFPAQFSPLEGTLAGGGVAALVVAMVFGVPIVRLIGVAAGIATLAILVGDERLHPADELHHARHEHADRRSAIDHARATLIWVIIAIVAAFAYKQSRNGLRLRATRENDPAARSVGVHVARERYIAFALSGFLCGIIGALYGHYFITFSYLDFYFDLTFLTIAMLVVGGMGSVYGAVVGTSFLTVIYVFFQRFEVNGIAGATVPSGTADVVMALALLVALILRPKGLTAGREIPWPGDWRWLQKTREPAPAAQAPSAE